MVAKPTARDRTHENEAREGVIQAESVIDKLKRAIGRGEPVAGHDLAAARADLEIAEAGVERGKRLDREAAAQAQADRLAPIYADIDAYELPDFPALVRELHTVAAALSDVVTTHNRRVSGWEKALRDAGTASDMTGAVTTPAGTTQARHDLSGLLAEVFSARVPRKDSRIRIPATPVVELKTRDGDHAEKAVLTEAERQRAGRLMAPVPRVSEYVRPEEAFPYTPDEDRARRAAELRYRRDDEGRPIDENNPSAKFPDWIDDPRLVALLPHISHLNSEPGARVVKVREEAPIVVGRV